MIRCADCGKLSERNQRTHERIIQTRKKDYFDKNGTFQGTGFETVKAIRICGVCNKKTA